MIQPRLRWIAGLLALSGCAAPRSETSPRVFAAPRALTATLAGPLAIDLKWEDHASDAGGYVVEYTTGPEDEFIILDAVPRDATSFRHADLVPEQRFVYRVRPFFGPASGTVQVVTGPAPAADATDAPQDEAKPGPSGSVSLRAGTASVDAAPADLMAHLAAPTRVDLKWRDRARDEDGFLVETSTALDGPYKASAFVDPDVTSASVSGLPPETKCYFRVRAFVYGPASNLAERTTGRRP
jgi:hypothetical protein